MRQNAASRLPLVAAGCAALLTSACSVQPRPFTAAETAARVAADRAVLYAAQEPVQGPVTLEEAFARALRYNLDARLAAHEQAVQNRQLALAPFDMLPRVAASAGYVTRDRELATRSFSSSTGQVSNDTFVGSDRNRNVADLGFTWNILDFGASYMQAQQQADRALIAAERRRKTIHNLLQEVEGAYWQAVAAQRIQPRLETTLTQTRRALATIERLERARSLEPSEALRSQRELLEILRQLETVSDDLAIVRARLSALMGMPPGSPYTLPSTPEMVRDAPLAPLAQLEDLALTQRPELREAAYDGRIVALEARRALLRLLPGITLNGSLNYDSNSFLLYNNWAEAGARLALDLVRLASLPQTLELNATQRELSETRRQALSMAVLAQVHVAALQLARAEAQHQRAVRQDAVEQRIARLSGQRQADQAGSDLDRVRDTASALLSELRRHRTFAELRTARATMDATIGQDPLPQEVAGLDIQTLAAEIRRVRAEGPSLPPSAPQVVASVAPERAP